MHKSLMDNKLAKIAQEIVAKENPYEGYNEKYDELLKELTKDISQYELFYERSMGTVYIMLSNDISVWCTPFWEGSKGIQIDVSNPDGESLYNDTVDFPVTGDVQKDARTYKNIMIRELFKIKSKLKDKLLTKKDKDSQTYRNITKKGIPKITGKLNKKVAKLLLKIAKELDQALPTFTRLNMDDRDAEEEKDAKMVFGVKKLTGSGYGRFSKDLSNILEAIIMNNKNKNMHQIRSIVKADKKLMEMIKKENMTDDELLDLISDELKMMKRYVPKASVKTADEPEKINFERNGFKAKMKRDAKTKKGIEFKRGEEVTLNWLEKMPQMTFIIKADGQRLRVRSEIAHNLVTGVNAAPSMRQLEKWNEDNSSKSMLGKKVEPDGFDPNGSPSWMLVIGII